MNKKINIAIIVLLTFGAGAVSAEALMLEGVGVACTQEAKLCQDGTYVSRTGPNCEFTRCGTVISSPTAPIMPNPPTISDPGSGGEGGWSYTGGTPCFDETTGKDTCVNNQSRPSPVAMPNDDIRSTTFTAEDKIRGWYYGDKNQKKPGTPADWLVRNAGTRSAQWFNPGLTTKKPLNTTNLPPKPITGMPPISRPGISNEGTVSREEMEARAKSLRASTTVATQKTKDGAQKKRIEVARKQTELVNKRLESAINRVQKLSDRISEKLSSLEKEGVDVSTPRLHIAEVKIKLDNARTKVAAVKLAVEAIFADTDQKDAIKNVQTLVTDATIAIKDAHSSVAKAISSIKPGINKQVPATTTAQ